MTSIYQFEAELLDGKNKRLADYEGKVLLIVIPRANVVSLHNLQVWKSFTRNIKSRDWKF